jgi:hypothetical protein
MITSIIDYLPTEADKAISREALATLTGHKDRIIRDTIAKLKTEYPIVNVGNGYYIATDPDDPNLTHYIRQEQHRAREILKGIKSHKRLLKRDQIDGQLSLFD